MTPELKKEIEDFIIEISEWDKDWFPTRLKIHAKRIKKTLNL